MTGFLPYTSKFMYDINFLPYIRLSSKTKSVLYVSTIVLFLVTTSFSKGIFSEEINNQNKIHSNDLKGYSESLDLFTMYAGVVRETGDNDDCKENGISNNTDLDDDNDEIPDSIELTVVNPQVTLVNSLAEGISNSTFDFANNVYNVSFDAGANADKIVLALASEKESGAVSITYGGTPLTLIIPTSSSSAGQGVYYLDLQGTGYTGGSATLSFDLTAASVVNGIGYSALSLEGTKPDFEVSNTSASTKCKFDNFT